MIGIKMYNQKWQIHIGEEEGKEIWQFDKIEDLLNTLKTMLELKEKFGKLKPEEQEEQDD